MSSYLVIYLFMLLVSLSYGCFRWDGGILRVGLWLSQEIKPQHVGPVYQGPCLFMCLYIDLFIHFLILFSSGFFSHALAWILFGNQSTTFPSVLSDQRFILCLLTLEA